MSSSEVLNENDKNSQKKKDVIDEAIERIQEKLKQLKTQKKDAQKDAEEERKRRFQERMKTFSSVESTTENPPKTRWHDQNRVVGDNKSSNEINNPDGYGKTNSVSNERL